MGLSDLFIDPADLPDGAYGFIQLLFLLVVYAYILCTGSGYISDGSELLLLIPSLAGIVGSVILPVLGAVPDGAIVLFSGMGPDAQEQLSVGVGALAGSTIMLLTLPWFLSVIAGRVSADDDGSLRYTKHPKLVSKEAWKLNCAVDCAPDISKGGFLMILTSISYLVIQLPAFSFEGDSDEEVAAGEKKYALIGLILCSIFFLGYLWYQWHLSQNKDEKQTQKQNQVVKNQMAEGLINVVDAFRNDFEPYAHEMAKNYEEKYGESYQTRSIRLKKKRSGASLLQEIKSSLPFGSTDYTTVEDTESPKPTDGLFKDEDLKKRFEDILRSFFYKYDENKNGSIEMDEIRLVFKDLNEKMSKKEMEILFKTFDTNDDGQISFDEFVIGTAQYIVNKILEEDESEEESTEVPAEQEDVELEEDQEEIPEEFTNLKPSQRGRAILMKSFKMMFLGTFVVLLFSDPMVDVLTEVGARTGVPSFYVAFVLAPLASNASELIASYNYALKKTKPTILVSLSALQGAACMNNTFCLAVFLALIYFRGLAWEFSAETASIILVQIVMALFSCKNKQTIVDAFLVLLMYPLSLVFVAVLEANGWD